MPIPIIIPSLFLYLLLCGVTAFMGRRRRIGFWGFFFLSVLVTPFLTAVFIFAAGPGRSARRAVPKRG